MSVLDLDTTTSAPVPLRRHLSAAEPAFTRRQLHAQNAPRSVLVATAAATGAIATVTVVASFVLVAGL